jgi:cob(I)alamin adenosyltransferase
MKIYTKTGDAGQTSLFGGRRVPKDDLRVAAYGTVDELNAFIGLLADHLPAGHAQRAILHEVQHRLFSLGAHLAADPEKMPLQPDLEPEDIELLEQQMDTFDTELPPLRNFILPGGHPTVSYTHVCRTISRRAEREVVTLHREQAVNELALQYLNRLSDYFFVLGRHLAQALQADEVIWTMRTQ